MEQGFAKRMVVREDDWNILLQTTEVGDMGDTISIVEEKNGKITILFMGWKDELGEFEKICSENGVTYEEVTEDEGQE